MINTKHFIEYNISKSQCETNILSDVNALISDLRIQNSNIVEYRTNISETEHTGCMMWKYEVIISWWA